MTVAHDPLRGNRSKEELRSRRGACVRRHDRADGVLPNWSSAACMARRLRCWRWLLFHTRQRTINTRPTWRTGCPDGHCRFGKIRIIESAHPNEDQMRSRLGFAEERCTAVGAESAVHSIATVRHARIVTRPPYNRERRGAKASANRSTARAQILAFAAPANARGNRRFSALPTNCSAKAPACHWHRALHRQRHRSGAPQIVRLIARAVPPGPPNPSLHPTCASLRQSPLGELQR